jgi:hypothetical protein
MEIHSTKLVIYSTLVALGVILMLLGISWLMFLGIADHAVGSFFFTEGWAALA